MNTMCFLSGIGFQELTVLLIFLSFLIGIPVALIILFAKVARRNRKPAESAFNYAPANTPIIRNAAALEKLKDLQEKGVITREEFDAEKAKILSGEKLAGS